MSFRHVPARWDGAILVCSKCSKKVGGGFGDKGRTPLAKALRKSLGLKKGRKASLGIVESRCLGVCPKNGVTVMNATRTRDWLVVAPGTDVQDVVVALFLDPAAVVSVAPPAPMANGVEGSEAFQA